MINKTEIVKDLAAKKLIVTRDFNAPVEKVWRAWTDASILDQWWAPKPWRTETKSMNFTEGGSWLYSMVSPEGERHWSKADFGTIVPQSSFTAVDAFCDEEGNTDVELPTMHWLNEFNNNGDKTRVNVTLTFESEEAIQQMVDMGFNEGFSMAHDNLEELLAE